MYVTVEYENEDNVVNQVVIWDRIIQREEDAYIELVNELVEYPLQDQGSHLRLGIVVFIVDV